MKIKSVMPIFIALILLIAFSCQSDKKNNIWFATESGVSKFDGEHWIKFSYVHEKKFQLHSVRTIDLDTKGNIWLGTTFGFVKQEM